jgi:hypothetical protein
MLSRRSRRKKDPHRFDGSGAEATKSRVIFSEPEPNHNAALKGCGSRNSHEQMSYSSGFDYLHYS